MFIFEVPCFVGTKHGTSDNKLQFQAENIGKNPLYLVFPVALAATYSFVLPMAGDVNAWILTSGYASVRDSVRVQIIFNNTI